MDNSNWRPAQAEPPTMDAGDWRSQLPPGSRQRIVNKIVETLKKHLPFPNQLGLREIKKTAVKFEENIYIDATGQSDYLRKISLEMLTVEAQYQNTIANSLPSNSLGNSKTPSDTGHTTNKQMASIKDPDIDTDLDTGNWRSQLQPNSRQRIVNKIMETLKNHLPFSGQEGLHEIEKIAVRFEEKMYAAATSQTDYLRKISLKMLTIETKSRSTIANSLPSNSPCNSKNPSDPASHSMQSQVHDGGQTIPLPLAANQSEAREQLICQDQSFQRQRHWVGSSSSRVVRGKARGVPQAYGIRTADSSSLGINSNFFTINNYSNRF